MFIKVNDYQAINREQIKSINLLRAPEEEGGAYFFEFWLGDDAVYSKEFATLEEAVIWFEENFKESFGITFKNLLEG